MGNLVFITTASHPSWAAPISNWCRSPGLLVLTFRGVCVSKLSSLAKVKKKNLRVANYQTLFLEIRKVLILEDLKA